MPGWLARLGLGGEARDIFEAKQSAIHNAKIEVELRGMREAKMGRGTSDDSAILVGEDNG
jgi:hypothetical protein